MKKVFLALLAGLMLLLCACNAPKTFEWDDVEMSGVLPKPKSSKGEFWLNDESYLSLQVEEISQDDYKDYISSCKEQGFTVDGEKTRDSYEAYNREGYKLSLSYWKSSRRMDISLYAPVKMGALQWPKSDIAALLPVPKSTKGKTEREAEDGFAMYVGNTSQEEFRAYADACAERGFTVGYQRGDDYYYANNADGFHIDLRYEGNQTMLLRIDAPEESDTQMTSIFEQEERPEELLETEPEEEPQETEKITSEPEIEPTPETETSELVNGMRPEFQEAMDSCEAFFDDYCDFMEKFDKADDVSMEMLAEYLDFMENYIDMMEKMEAWESGELNDAELSYYLKVTTRINEKLMKLAD